VAGFPANDHRDAGVERKGGNTVLDERTHRPVGRS
jgi:hypothetical protein